MVATIKRNYSIRKTVKCSSIKKKYVHLDRRSNGSRIRSKNLSAKTLPDTSGLPPPCFAPKKKRNKLPLLPVSLVEDRSTLSYFLFLTGPADAIAPFDLPFIESIKQQIFVAQVLCNAMAPGNKYRRSTCGNSKVKKLRKKIDRLGTYFLDSTLAIRPDGRKARKMKSVIMRKTLKTPKIGPVSKKSVITRKRRKFRIPKKIHIGPYYAHTI